MSEMNGVNRPPRVIFPRLDPSRDIITAAPKERLQKLLDTVNSGSSKTIRDLACEFNMSTSHIQHLFKAQTGSCLGRTLTGERLRKAATLLLEGNLSVKEIAYIVGYKHPSSFIRAFERSFGQAPSRYRQAMNEIDKDEM
jgi:AraC-like DNA-binding protein